MFLWRNPFFSWKSALTCWSTGQQPTWKGVSLNMPFFISHMRFAPMGSLMKRRRRRRRHCFDTEDIGQMGSPMWRRRRSHCFDIERNCLTLRSTTYMKRRFLEEGVFLWRKPSFSWISALTWQSKTFLWGISLKKTIFSLENCSD